MTIRDACGLCGLCGLHYPTRGKWQDDSFIEEGAALRKLRKLRTAIYLNPRRLAA